MLYETVKDNILIINCTKMSTPFVCTEIIQYLAVFFGALNIVTSGLQYGWAAASLPHFQNPNDTSVNVHLTASQGSWVAVGTLLGSLIGGPLTGATIDIVGRRSIIMFTFFPYLIAWLCIALATSTGVLVLGRISSGISDGCMFTALPIYIGEISNPKVRGMLCSSVPVSLMIGVLIINIMEIYLSVTQSAFTCIVFPLISFLGMLFMPESPYYLLMRNRTSEARATLERIRGTDDVDEEFDRISGAVKAQKKENNGNFKDIFTIPSNRKAFFIMILLRSGQELSGITALTFYISLIFKESGAVFSVSFSTIIFFVAQLVMTILGSVSVDWTGRRILLLMSALGSAISLSIEGLYLQMEQNHADLTQWSFVPLTALIIFVIFYGFGLQIIPLLMVGELFPTNIKAMVSCIGNIYFALLALFVAKFFQITNSSIGGYVPFYTFAGCCLIIFVLIYIFVPETKRITLEEIQSLLKEGRKFKRRDDGPKTGN